MRTLTLNLPRLIYEVVHRLALFVPRLFGSKVKERFVTAMN